MTYIEAPDRRRLPPTRPSIFLAGGITGCPNWQYEAAAQIAIWGGKFPITVLNPRRENFPIHDPDAAEEQIIWEFEHLRIATVILFWFPESPSPQPIALYELGRHIAQGDPVVVGVDPKYSRAQDVRIQTALANSNIDVCDRLGATVERAVRLAEVL